MKNLTIIIIFLTTSLISSANNLDPIKDFKNTVKKEKINNNINQIVISFVNPKQLFEFNFDSAEELIHFNLDAVKELILSVDKCVGNATISVTASVGVGKTYVSVTVTMQVPCEDIISETIKLKNKLTAAIK